MALEQQRSMNLPTLLERTRYGTHQSQRMLRSLQPSWGTISALAQAFEAAGRG
jgi:hypothetical protein